MRTMITLVLLTALFFLPALPLQAQLNDLDSRVQNERIETAPSCSGGVCPGSSVGSGSALPAGTAASLLGGIANACGGSGGFLGGIMDFFKQLFGGIVDFFRGIFGGGGSNGGGGGFNPPIDNGGGFTPPVDTGSIPPTTPVTPPTTPEPPPTTTTNPPTTPTQPPMDLSDLEKKAGLVEYKPTKNFNSSSSRMLNDIESHIAPKHGSTYRDSSKSTWAHETSHGICSDIRNGVARTLGGKVNGFYLGNNKAYIMKEFNLRKRHAAPYIPMSLRSSRYNLYISGQTAWDDTPSYIIDEWVAYTNGAITGVELAKAGQSRERTDGVKGAMEFTFYSLGLAMAVEKQDPGRFDEQFKAFMALQMKRAMAVYFEGVALSNFQGFGQEQLLQNFLRGSDSANMREFVKRVWGESFFNEVFVR